MLTAFESFDGVTAPTLPVDWTETATNTNSWTTVAGSSDTAPNHAFVANLNAVSESILSSPVFVLPAATPVLRFRNSYNVEAGFDGGVLEISVNGESFSDVVTAGGSFTAGGYIGTLESGSGNPIGGRSAWTGNSNGYITTEVTLPASAINQNVQLRWRFGTDDSVGETGWRLDTISLEAIPIDDFGDAPSGYPVTLEEDGARHTGGALRLGALVDIETNGLHSADASADGADEDGVVFDGELTRGTAKTIQVTASQAGGLLDAWVDWNADGDWSDLGEQVFANRSLSAGANSLTVYTPPDAISGDTFARFRISTTGGLSVTGTATDGEVEDYRVRVGAAGVWTNLGPFGATNGQVEGIVDRPVTGAVHVVLAHPSNADILYIGATNGGVWKTTNATAASPNWTPLTDSVASQSIGALSFDLSDPTFNTIYAGIGTYSSFGRIGNRRTGLIRSTDGGQSWQVVDGAGLLGGKNISGIYANGDTIVVSVNVADNFSFGNIGIFRSTDGGDSFTQISSGDGSGTGLPGGVSYDLFVDPVTPTTLYTSTVFSDLVGGVNGVYKSVNSGATWSKISSPAMDALITNNTSNLEIAVGRSNEVYAAIIISGAMAGLFRSPDGGANWTQMDSPKTNENGTDVGLNPSGGKGPTSGAPEGIAGGQGAIHFAMVADPNNADIVYVGGDRQPRTNGDTGGFPNSIGAVDFTGRLFRGDASKPAGSQFVHLTHRNDLGATGGGTASNSSPHADSRDMAFDSNGNLVEVDDGGVYRRTSPQSNTGDWFSVIGNLSVTEAHDVAWDSLSNVGITGNQDTGTTYQPGENATQWVSISTADGGDVAVDNLELAGSNRSVRYTSFQNLGGFRRTIWNAAGGLVSTTFPALTPINGSAAMTRGFRTPVETNSVAGGRLLIQGTNGLYESLNGGSTINAIGTSAGQNEFQANAMAYGGTQNNVANPDLVWAARGTDVFVRTSGTGSVVATTADPTTATIRDLAVNSRDWANAFVIDNNQVFQTTDVGAAWSDITGNLMTFAGELRSIAFVAGTASSSIIVGTNFGVYASTTAALGTWFLVGAGLPNVLAYDMTYDSTDDVLLVGTLGRGAWKLQNASAIAAGLSTPALTITSTDATYNNVAYVATASITGENSPAPELSFVYYSDAAGSTTISAPENVGTYFVRAFAAANSGNVAVQSSIAQFDITPFTLTGTITAADKDFDGTTSATILTRSLDAVFAGDDVTYSGGTATFDTAAFGMGKTVTATGLSLTGTDAGNYTVNTTATTTANINPVAKTPSVTNATTDEDLQTTSGLVISRNAGDGAEVTHFKITNIQNGSLFLNDGTTSVGNGDFLTFAQANAGLKFTPDSNLFSPSTTFSFDLQASLSNVDAGLGGSVVTALITVNAVNDEPVLAATTVNRSYVENVVSLKILPDLTVEDVDSSTLQSATIQITNFVTGEDVIGFANDGSSMGNISVVSNAGGVLTLTSAGSTATLLEWQAALRSVSYSNSSENPDTTDRQVDFEVFDASLGSNVVSAIIGVNAVNDAPTSVTLTPMTDTSAENTTVGASLKLSTIVIADADGGVNNLALSGTDASFFEIVTNELRLKAGTVLDFETKSTYNVTVEVNDSAVGGAIDASQSFTLTITNVNEAPTVVALQNTTTTLAENTNTTTAIKLADILVTDDALGTNNLTLSGTDAAFFEIVSNALRLKAGTVLDFEAKSLYRVTVEVNDAGVGGAVDASTNFTLNITNLLDTTSDADAFVVTYTITNATITHAINGGTPVSLGSFSLANPITLQGLAANDSVRVVGTSDNDVFVVDSSGLTIRGSRLILNGPASRTLAGGTGDDSYLFDADNVLGLYRLEESISGGGTDRLNFAATSAGVIANLGNPGTQTVHSTNLSLILGSATAFEILIGGSGNDILTGNSLANRIAGGNGHDRLTGSGGDDVIFGDLGDDTYLFGDATSPELDQVVESLGEGTDLLSFTTLTSALTLSLSDAMIQSIHTNRTLQLLTASGFENVSSGSGDDVLTGNDSANFLRGNGGNDRLIGAAGDDSLSGGTGDDTYLFGNVDGGEADRVLENSGEGNDTLRFSAVTDDITLSLRSTAVQSVHLKRTLLLSSGSSIENAIGGNGDDTLTGNSLDNILTGLAGNDHLSGGLGGDTLVGGLDNDTYVFDVAAVAESDTVTENAGQGVDTLDFSSLLASLVVNIGIRTPQTIDALRTLTLSSASGLDNVLGGSGDDILWGGLGANDLTGNGGNDILIGQAGNDRLFGNAGRDLLIGGLGRDELNGGSGDDILIAGRTSSDNLLSRLNDLRSAWIGGGDYATRVSTLRSPVGTSGASLKATINVVTDAGEDDILAGDSDLDWYFSALNDTISDLFAGEITDAL